MNITIGMGFPSKKLLREEKGASLLSLPSSYVVVDLETTGLDPQLDDIIEFGALRVEDGMIVERFSSLINPGYKINSFITKLTGITNEMLLSSPGIADTFPRFIDFIGSSIVIGHNVNFDINFIYDTCINMSHSPFKNNFLDTMRLSRRLFPQERHHRLCDIINRFNIGESVGHRALEDAEQTNRCYLYMKQYISDNNIDLKPSIVAKKKFSARDIQAVTTEFDRTSPIYEKMFVFTGKLEHMMRREAMQFVANSGGKCGDGINRNTNYLVLGNNDYCTTIKDGKSTKQKKAEQLKLAGYDIEIISENVFYDMILFNKDSSGMVK